MSKVVIRIAYHYLQNLKERDQNYELACKEAAKEGVIRHYCKPGFDQWVDFDCICPFCEDPEDNYTQALRLAHQDYSEYLARLDAVANFKNTSPLPDKLFQELMSWVFAPILAKDN